MTNHYVLSINPHAQYDWDKCFLRNPITGERPDLTAAIAQAVGGESGSYLVAVNIEVQVLETNLVTQERPEAKKTVPLTNIKKLVAS
ncbi:MAG: hypothetical protein DSM107014_11060 [Gomphosphaeria aponina SAG 52.96 = DSM 107014]|uniref:Uncharacterized protein n=1 Tax=Gomphosphaeria aponina SAG 52.96 = DSM 107014 TaxID=1521640 RepID=A0A941JQ33_9CHRO|nr:hypothetical protein [Gomphosphaeria aponina SAG 52.96 = DSM 107014]